MSPSTSASRRPRSSCCPFPTATSRRWPPPGSRTPMSCRPCGWPASSGCAIRCRSTSMSKASWRGRASSSCAAWAASITGATASSTSPTWRATMACCSPPCRATTAPIPGWLRRRPWLPSRWLGSIAFSAKAAPRICGRRLRYVATLLGRDLSWTAPVPVGPLAVLGEAPDGRPVALVVFYRANLMAADIAPITALMEALDRQGLAPLGVAVSSLKDAEIRPHLEELIATHKPAIILNTTAFSAMRGDDTTVLDAADVPVLQVVLSGSVREAWQGSARGLSPADLAMNVVLPELDGRLLTRAISFKAEAPVDPRLEFASVRHEPDADRIDYVARLATAWARLGTTPRERPSSGAGPVGLSGARRPHGLRGRPRHGGECGRDPEAAARRGLRHRHARMAGSRHRAPAAGTCRSDRDPDVGLSRLAERPAAGPPARAGRDLGGARGRCLPPARAPLRQCPRAAAARSRCAGRSQVGLSRRQLPAEPCLRRALCLAARDREDRRPGPSRHARHPGMAARQGAGAVGRLLARGGAGRAAGDLSLHRQQSRRGGAGQAASGRRHHRPSDAAAQRRRPARPAGRARRHHRGICCGRRSRPAAHELPRRRDRRTRLEQRACRRLRAAQGRAQPAGHRQARRPALRHQGTQHPRRPAHLRPARPTRRRCRRSRWRPEERRPSGPAAIASARRSSPRSTDAAWRPVRPARRRAAAPTCCRRGATSPRSIRAPSRPAPRRPSACAPPTKSCAATCRIMASRRARWSSTCGPRRRCAPAATISRRRCGISACSRPGTRPRAGSPASRSCRWPRSTGRAST